MSEGRTSRRIRPTETQQNTLEDARPQGHHGEKGCGGNGTHGHIALASPSTRSLLIPLDFLLRSGLQSDLARDVPRRRLCADGFRVTRAGATYDGGACAITEEGQNVFRFLCQFRPWLTSLVTANKDKVV